MPRRSTNKSSARPPRPNSYPDSHPPTVPEVVRRTPQQPQPVVIDDDLSGRPVSNEWAPPMYGAGPTSRGYGMNRYASDVPPGPFRTHLDRPSSSIPAPPSSTMSGVNGIPYELVSPSNYIIDVANATQYAPIHGGDRTTRASANTQRAHSTDQQCLAIRHRKE